MITTSIAAKPHRIIWLDRSSDLPMPGLLALADPDLTGRQQVMITDAGHARYALLRRATRDH